MCTQKNCQNVTFLLSTETKFPFRVSPQNCTVKMNNYIEKKIAKSEQGSHTPDGSHQRFLHFQKKTKSLKIS